MADSGKKTMRPGVSISAAKAEEFRKKLLKYLEEGVREITLDLKKVEMIDSRGLGVIIAAHNSLKKDGGLLRVKNASDQVYALFTAMRLDRHFEVEKKDEQKGKV